MLPARYIGMCMYAAYKHKVLLNFQYKYLMKGIKGQAFLNLKLLTNSIYNKSNEKNSQS